MEKYSYAKKLLHYHSFLADNECTKDYPFAYLNGKYCCETNQELVNGGSSNEVASVSFSSCQRNLIKTFQIEGMIALITKMTLIFSSDLLNGQK